mmetsp:Transcript_18231/g.27340  ORF Transcript_18231/g.27340 Transcript_18231/m.27340 type:complete len:99 (+) Transcript_18231:243-539(+)
MEVFCHSRRGGTETGDDENYDDYSTDDYDDQTVFNSNDDDNLMLMIISAAIAVCIVAEGIYFVHNRSASNKIAKSDENTDLSGSSEDLSLFEESLSYC